MEQFAVVGTMDNSSRYIQSHPVLKKLPSELGKSIMLRTGGPRITGTIFDRQEDNELGYIIDVPGFFIGWDMLTEEQRLKIIQQLLRIVEKRDIHILIIPLMNQLFSKWEYDYCVNRGFILLDGFHIRLASQVEAVEKILAILGSELHDTEAVIWRADTDLGEIWAEFLAPYFNYMVLGGEDKKRLEKLSEKIISATGLACVVADKVEDAVREGDLIVWTEREDISFYIKSAKVVIVSDVISEKQLTQTNGGGNFILLESGWIKLPEDIYCDVELRPLEEICVLEGIIHMLSEFYRFIVKQNSLRLKQVMELRELFKLYPLECQGYISSNRSFSYNGFRRAYFRKS